MNLTVVTTQVLLPILLLIWLAFFPARGILSYVLQTLSLGLILLGLGLASLWAMPPFWVPYVYGFVFIVLFVWHVSKGHVSTAVFWSASQFNTMLIVLAMGLGLAGGYLSLLALEGRRLPPIDVVDIAPPFSSGKYLIAHGGSTELINAHLHTLDASVARFRHWKGQSRAMDIFKISPSGFHVDGWRPTDPARYVSFGTPVLAPCTGVIVKVVNGLPDMQVPQMDRANMAGNYVAINCMDFYVIMAHLRNRSIHVRHGDAVKTGDLIGEIGNSGNSSEPHLHIHAQRGLPQDAPFADEPLWLTINGEFPVRNDRLAVEPE